MKLLTGAFFSVNKNEPNEKEWMVLETGDRLIESSALT